MIIVLSSKKKQVIRLVLSGIIEVNIYLLRKLQCLKGIILSMETKIPCPTSDKVF
jgi:hypothetical protein